jgi:hypothetical protein
MSNHTPGPWGYTKDTDARGNPCYIVDSDCTFGLAVLTYATVSQRDAREPDARLIATAPEMYGLLRELIDIEGPQPGNFERARQWRENLKTGDPVLIWNGWVHNPATVERTTPTQIIVRGSKYRRNGGARIGGGTWDRIVLVEPTPELLEEMRQKQERQAVEWFRKVSAVLAKADGLPLTTDRSP